MKRYIIILITTIFGWQATNAMSYEQARQEALYLTDKMAYELNLNDQQYNDAYEINLDYFLSLNNEADLYKDYLSYRLSDLRHILYDWQYNLMIAADYFIRPIYWRSGVWHFSIYNYYDHGYFYYRTWTHSPSSWILCKSPPHLERWYAQSTCHRWQIRQKRAQLCYPRKNRQSSRRWISPRLFQKRRIQQIPRQLIRKK